MLGDRVNSYKDISVLTIEPAPSIEIISELAAKHDLDRLENDEHEVVLFGGFPIRSHNTLDKISDFLRYLSYMFPKVTFVSGIYNGKMSEDIIKKAKKNKYLLNEIIDKPTDNRAV